MPKKYIYIECLEQKNQEELFPVLNIKKAKVSFFCNRKRRRKRNKMEGCY
jgi:hypothetical protein